MVASFLHPQDYVHSQRLVGNLNNKREAAEREGAFFLIVGLKTPEFPRIYPCLFNARGVKGGIWLVERV
jgi:hypothetical protein